eukprot:GILJ01001693.1.p1 GENE.GILJ01001693.1~~GILJ01001693.1.p1  ORF type:complete len:679 (+),score=132.34 GILJ01001693.1:114-2150(+)
MERIVEAARVHVLVVEDDTFQRLALIDILTLCNFKTTDLENGKLALEELQKPNQDFDLVLLDVMMPEMDGMQLLDYMQADEKLKNIPVIMMSSSEETQQVASCLAKGAKDYLIKPIRVQVVRGLAHHVSKARKNRSMAAPSIEQYEKVKTLGRGTSGAVLLVKRTSDDKHFALKQIPILHLNENEKKLAFNEVQLLKVLVGPTIVRYYDSFMDQDMLNIVMEYCEGGTVAEHIKRHKESQTPFSDEQILSWFAQLVLAVMIMDSKNILHRDIKTQNIFLSKENHVKLGDFGIAKTLSDKTLFAQTACGTPYFMSPEVCRGETYNQKSDIWALGCTLYELTTLKKPFDHETLSGVFERIRGGSFDQLPESTHPDIRTLIMAMLTVDPNRRPSIWDVARMPSIKERMQRFVEETHSQSEVMAVFALEVKKPFSIALSPSTTADSLPSATVPVISPEDTVEREMQEVVELLHESIVLEDHKTGWFSKEPRCFQGTQLIQVLTSAKSLSQDKAASVGSALVDSGLICEVSGKKEFDPSLLYRFSEDQPNLPLNQLRIWEGAARDPLTVVNHLLDLKAKAIATTDASPAHLNRIFRSSQFRELVNATGELQKVTVAKLPRKDLEHFWSTIHEILGFHIAVQSSNSHSDSLVRPAWSKWFSKANHTYNVGGQHRSLRDIEGLLS